MVISPKFTYSYSYQYQKFVYACSIDNVTTKLIYLATVISYALSVWIMHFREMMPHWLHWEKHSSCLSLLKKGTEI